MVLPETSESAAAWPQRKEVALVLGDYLVAGTGAGCARCLGSRSWGLSCAVFACCNSFGSVVALSSI